MSFRLLMKKKRLKHAVLIKINYCSIIDLPMNVSAKAGTAHAHTSSTRVQPRKCEGAGSNDDQPELTQLVPKDFFT